MSGLMTSTLLSTLRRRAARACGHLALRLDPETTRVTVPLDGPPGTDSSEATAAPATVPPLGMPVLRPFAERLGLPVQPVLDSPRIRPLVRTLGKALAVLEHRAEGWEGDLAMLMADAALQVGAQRVDYELTELAREFARQGLLPDGGGLRPRFRCAMLPAQDDSTGDSAGDSAEEQPTAATQLRPPLGPSLGLPPLPPLPDGPLPWEEFWGERHFPPAQPTNEGEGESPVL